VKLKPFLRFSKVRRGSNALISPSDMETNSKEDEGLIGSEGEAGVPSFRRRCEDSRPVIGLLAQKCKGPKAKYGYQYLAASYVQWIESAGGKVVPVKIDQERSYYEELLQNLNGLMLPGGGQDLLESGYARAARFFLTSARRKFDAGEDYFPIWGTCLGFEEIAVLAQEENMLKRCRGCQNVSMTTRFENDEDEDEEEGEKEESRLLKGIPKWAKETFATKKIAPHFHIFCLPKHIFQSSLVLQNEFRIVSTASDEDGNEFVDMFESKKYPFYGVQFHPEKNAFEWSSSLSICHDSDAILASQSLILFFVAECRRNRNKSCFSSSSSSISSSSSSSSCVENLIEHYTPIDTSAETVFHRCYFF